MLADRFIDDTVADIEGVRLAEHQVGLAAAQHGGIAFFHPLSHRTQSNDRRHPDTDADYRQECPPFLRRRFLMTIY
jgi:hypothetical protein